MGAKRLRWSPEDRAKSLAFTYEKALRCTMCGTAEWEWDEAQGGKRHAYEAVEKFCHGCYARASGQTHDPHRNMDGITVELAPTGTREAAQRLLRARERRR